MSGLRRAVRSHGKIIVVGTFVFVLTTIGFLVKFRSVKKNYTELHERVATLERLMKH